MTVEEMAQRIAEREAVPGYDTAAATTAMESRILRREMGMTAAGGPSWKWQLRDKDGKWVQMGSNVKWFAQGRPLTGKIVGSPNKSTAIVQSDDGRRYRVSTRELTATDASAKVNGPITSKSSVKDRTAKMGRKVTRAALLAKQTPKMKQAMKDVQDAIREDVAPENQAAAVDAATDVAVGEVAKRLPAKVRNLKPMQAVISRGLKAINKLDHYFAHHERANKVVERLRDWADEYISEVAGGSTQTPGIGAAFMSVGLPNPFTEPVQFLVETQHHIHALIELASHHVGMLGSADDPLPVTAAGGQSWKWQLRDKNGTWIDMGALVKWFANGKSRSGKIVGSHKEGEAEVEESNTKRRIRIMSSRLTSLAEKVAKDDTGSIALPGGRDEKQQKAVSKGSQPEPDTTPEPKASLMESAKNQLLSADLPPARPDGSSEEPRPGANDQMKEFFSKSRNPDGSRRPGRSVDEGATGTEEDPIYVGNDVDEAVNLLVQGKHIRMSESPTVAMVVQKLGPALEQAEKDIKAKYNIPKGKTALDFPEGAPERQALEGLGLNMCAIQVPGTNIFCVKHKGVPRISMPQLSGKDKETGEEKNVQPWAEEMLDSMDLIDPITKIKADTVTASQSELGAIQIAQMLDSYKNWKTERDRIAGMPDGPEKDAAAAELERRSNPKTKDPKDFTYMSEDVLTAPILVSKDGYIIDGHHRWAVLIATDLEDGGLGDVDMNVRKVDMEIGESLATVNAFADAAGIARKAPKGAAAPKEVPVPEILKDAHVRKEIETYIADNMDKILARVKAGSKEGILAGAVQEGNVLLALLASGDVSAHKVLRIVAETSGGRSFLREDIYTGALSLAIMTPRESIVAL